MLISCALRKFYFTVTVGENQEKYVNRNFPCYTNIRFTFTVFRLSLISTAFIITSISNFRFPRIDF